MSSNNLKHFTLELVNGSKNDEEKLKKIYYFVRDKILFDLVEDQFMSSEEILKIRRGSCMNKALLLHDMAKAVEISVRLHFMKVSKKALEDLLHPFVYKLWPKSFLHTYPEINLDGNWVPMEATFDKELHQILLKKRLNFAKYNDRRNIAIEFDTRGVYGTQQDTIISGSKAIYASNLEPLRKSLEGLPGWKLRLQPLLFRMSSKWINNKVRS